MQPRLRQRLLELHRAHLTLALARVGVGRMDGHHHEGVEQQLQRHLVEGRFHERPREGGGVHAVVGDDEELQGHPPGAVQHADDHAAEHVDEQVPARRRDHREEAGEARDPDGHEDPAVPDHDLVERKPDQRVVVLQHAEPDLEGAHHAEQRPERGRASQDPGPPELHGRQCAATPFPAHPEAANGSRAAASRSATALSWATVGMSLRAFAFVGPLLVPLAGPPAAGQARVTYLANEGVRIDGGTPATSSSTRSCATAWAITCGTIPPCRRAWRPAGLRSME